MMRHFSKDDEKRRKELLEICKKHSGEYLSPFHGKGSWATTYSNEFLEASAGLYLLYKRAGSYDPNRQLSEDFRKFNIRSCRGAQMNLARVKYLYDTHIKGRLKKAYSNLQ